MGRYLRGIVGHHLQKNQILQLPIEIDSWNDVRSLKQPLDNYKLFLDSYEKQKKTISHWSYLNKPSEDWKISEEDLELIWRHHETDGRENAGIIFYNNLIDSFFGNLFIFRNTIEIEHSPEGKYDNLQSAEIAKMIFKINRTIASKFGSKAIVYAPDSTDLPYDSRKLSSIQEVIHFAIDKYGVPSDNIVEAMRNGFFIDYINNPPIEFEDWTWSD